MSVTDNSKEGNRKKRIKQSILYLPPNISIMKWKSLCNLDDLSKFLLLDHCSAYLKKMSLSKLNVPFESFIIEESKIIKENFFKTGNIQTALSGLLELIDRFKLYQYFDLQNHKDWVEKYLNLYLLFLHDSCNVHMQETDRYSSDRNKGVKIVAKVNIEAHTNINNLFGVYLPVTSDVENYLCQNNLDFSMIITESKSNTSNLLLGSIAFVNHDCKPNCFYKYVRKDMAIIRTSKDIKAGEEVLVRYSNHYFDDNECECQTCKDQKKSSKY